MNIVAPIAETITSVIVNTCSLNRLRRIKDYREKQRQWLIGYKKGLACVRCGESHPATLQFHHRNHEEKDFEIGLYTALGFSKKRLLAEIEKCDVLCANCHAKEHWSHIYETLP